VGRSEPRGFRDLLLAAQASRKARRSSTGATVGSLAKRQPRPGDIEAAIKVDRTEAYFAKKGCKVLVQPTSEAIDVFKGSQAK
jgi:hypothetical protein